MSSPLPHKYEGVWSALVDTHPDIAHRVICQSFSKLEDINVCGMKRWFDPRTDKRIWNSQDWSTMLRTTGLIQKTLNTPALQGTLDANGQGAVTVTLSLNPAYIGVTFYARALITHPIYPGKIVTQTSLHSMTLQP